MSDDNELNMTFSEDGGETWSIKFENSNVLCDILKIKYKKLGE